MGIGKTLSDILSEQKRNPNELAERIGESPSTIYSIIRRDNMKVDITVLAKICSELNVDMERFYSSYLQTSSNHVSDIKKEELIANYNQLNDQGKQKLLEYSADLVNSGNYISEPKEKRA